MSKFDDRLIKVIFTYGDTQVEIDGTQANIYARGMRYADATQNECAVTISNLRRETRDRLATQLTPFNYDQARKSVKIFAGRKSTGWFLLYAGDITRAMSSQPPDIDLEVQSIALYWYRLNYLAQAQNVATKLSTVVNSVGLSLGTLVRFEADDRTIENYSYSGSVAGQIDHINGLGLVDLYEDNGVLVCKERGASRPVTHVLSSDSGMVGQPMVTEFGIAATMMLAPQLVLGGKIDLESRNNPFLDGEYTIYQLGFEVASRDVPFYAHIEASKYPIIFGIAGAVKTLNTGP